MTYRRRPPVWPWRDFLTEEEASAVRDAERKIETAKYEMAMASMIRQPIQNRAINRAKYAARKAALSGGASASITDDAVSAKRS